MKFILKHKYFFIGLLAILGGIFVIAAMERTRVLSNTTESTMENPPRTQDVFTSTFYFDQLTDKEKLVYEQLTDCMEKKTGGVITLKEPLNGTEYTRICNALVYDEKDYFYGLVDIPMTADYQYLLYDKNKTPTDITESSIEKCILFLYCAKGIDEKGSYDEEGYVENIEQMEKDLAVNDPKRLEEIEKISKNTEETLNQVIEGIPEGYGQKETLDYFMDWMKENLKFDAEEYANLMNVTSMRGMFEQCYFRSNTSCVSEQKALTAGFNKVLMTLCNRAGMKSHVVSGIWKREEAGYMLTSVQLGDTTIYVDASAYYAQQLAEQRYLREEEAENHMTFPEYFDYK